jgi:Flp pilus assembly protein TadG
MIVLTKIFQRTLARKMSRAGLQDGLNDDCGSAILETAMSMIILLTFLFGVMEGSLALYTYHFIAEASREAVRYAIVRGSSAGGTCASYTSPTCAVTTAQITSYVQNIGFPGIDPSKMTVNTSYAPYPAGVTCTPSAACNNPGNLVTVNITYNFPLTVPFVPAHSYLMSSTSAMVISQ